MTTRFKICGLRTAEAVAAAVAAGADAIGLNFYPPSPRYLTVAEAGALARQIPPLISRVALFVETPAAEIRSVARQVGADTVQLYGASPADFAALADFRRLGAFAAEPGETLARLEPFLPELDAVLLDAAVPGEWGGTGQPAAWAEAAAVVEALEIPVILAGGLTADNVAAAIAEVRPYAVDVASGIEVSRGVADPARILAFGDAVRRAS